MRYHKGAPLARFFFKKGLARFKPVEAKNLLPAIYSKLLTT
jgi:hypothetical protein